MSEPRSPMIDHRNPFLAPEHDKPARVRRNRRNRRKYAGFWIRFLAVVIDGLILGLSAAGLMYLLYGQPWLDDESLYYNGFEVFLDYGVPLIYTIGCWWWISATPGKAALNLVIIDTRTGGPIGRGQAVGRYFAYVLSGMLLGIGYLMAAFDGRKRSLHDRICNTLVVKKH